MNEFLDGTRQVRAGEELDLARLEPYLAEQLGAADGPIQVEQFPAGHSNLTYRIAWGSSEYVLRRPPFGSKVKSAHDMGREFRVLDKLHRVYAPAPEPLLHCDDDVVLGAPFYVMRRIQGVILRKELPEGLDFSPSIARGVCESLVDNLAALHSLDYEQIGLGDLGKPAGYMERQVHGWIKRYSGSRTDDIPEVDQVSKWLTTNLPPQGETTLVHNDYKLDNLILAADDLTHIVGVLDWEMSTLGDPLSDLGTAIMYWIDPEDPAEMQLIRWGPTTQPGCLNRRGLVDRYAQVTSRDVSNINYYYVFALFKTAVVAQQIYYRYHQGLTTDARFAMFIEATKILFRAALRASESGKI